MGTAVALIAYWVVTFGEQPRIQPSVSWIAKSMAATPTTDDCPSVFFEATVQQILMGPLLNGQPGAKL